MNKFFEAANRPVPSSLCRFLALARARRCFTLLEMLMVMSIIIVMIALLVPSLRAAKEEGKMAVCMNNLRNIGLAMIMYGDERGNYPWGYEVTTDWSYTIQPYLQKVSGQTYVTGAAGRSPVISCPTRSLKSTNTVNTYGTHDRLLGNQDPGSPYKISPPYPRLVPWRERPSDIWMAGDAAQDPSVLGGESQATIWNILPEMGQDYVGSTGNSKIANVGNNLDQAGSLGQVRWRHHWNERACFVFVDGHVESIHSGNMQERQLKITGP